MSRGSSWVDELSQDLGAALRNVRRRPGFASAVVLTMALGIGINTAMLGVVHQTLLSPLPYPDADRLTYIWKDLTAAGYARAPLAPPELADLRAASSLHESIGGIWATSGTLVEEGRPESISVGKVTANFFAVLGVHPVRGRWFTEHDGRWGAPPPIVISAGLWQSRFGGGDVIGRTVRIDGGFALDGGTYTVVGVMPAGFELLLPPDSRVPRVLDAWVPLQFDLASAPRSPSFLSTIGRLAPGASFTSALEQIEAVSRTPAYAGSSSRFYAVPLHADLVRNVRPALVILQVVVGFVLLIACGGVAGLVLVRAQERRTEIGIRIALGATRRRLTRLLLTEALLLGAAGGLLGVSLAYVALRLLPLVEGGALPLRVAGTLGGPVLAVSAITCLAPALLFGLMPLLQPWADVVPVINTGGRGSVRAPSQRARRALVLAQIGVTVALLVVAGLLVRSFRNLLAVDPGYSSAQVLSFLLALPLERYGGLADLSRFSRDLERELRQVPGVEAAGAANQLPLDDSVGNGSTGYRTRATEAEPGAPIADARFVTPGYFSALQANLIAGRWFTEQDDETQPLVLIVDEQLAGKAWPGESPLDQELSVRVWTDRGIALRWGRVVGLVRHFRHHHLSEEVREQVFVPFAQAPRNQMGVVVRARGEPLDLVQAITARLARIDPNLAPARVRLLDSYLDRSRAPARLNTLLATLFAALSLVLACLSLYGLISYSVAQRVPELVVRAALGADGRDLVRLVVGQGAALIAVGIALGLAAAVGAARWLKGLLFGVAALDPVIFIGAPAVLGLIALLACYIPARRAAGVDLARAFRTE